MDVIVKDFTVESWDGNRRCNDRRSAHTPRIFLDVAGESLLENIVIGRWTRPHAAVKAAVMPQVLESLGLSGAKVRWSQFAGCSCPCSPGFIVTTDHPVWNDFTLTVTLAEKPALTPEQNALADARFSQLAADPTLPLDALANTKVA